VQTKWTHKGCMVIQLVSNLIHGPTFMQRLTSYWENIRVIIWRFVVRFCCVQAGCKVWRWAQRNEWCNTALAAVSWSIYPILSLPLISCLCAWLIARCKMNRSRLHLFGWSGHLQRLISKTCSCHVKQSSEVHCAAANVTLFARLSFS